MARAFLGTTYIKKTPHLEATQAYVGRQYNNPGENQMRTLRIKYGWNVEIGRGGPGTFLALTSSVNFAPIWFRNRSPSLAMGRRKILQWPTEPGWADAIPLFFGPLVPVL